MSARTQSGFRSWFSVALLSATLFLFVSSALMPMGLLPDIAADLDKSEAQTGLLVTSYAWTAALAALPLILFFSSCDRKPLVLGVLGLCALSHVWAAFAPTFFWLMASRVLTALANALFWGLSTPMAVSLVPEHLRSRALAVMAAGTALAAVLGVPAGTLLGQVMGWRASFLAVAALAACLATLMALLISSMPASNNKPFASLGWVLKSPALTAMYGVMFCGTLAHATAFTYFTPFMRIVGTMPPDQIVTLLGCFGVFGVFGGFLSSLVPAGKTRAAMLVSLILLGANFLLLSTLVALGMPGALTACLVWGAGMTGLGVLYQSAVIRHAGTAPDVAMAVYSVFFNAALGTGAFVGAGLFAGFGIGSVAFGASALCIMAVAGLLVFRMPEE